MPRTTIRTEDITSGEVTSDSIENSTIAAGDLAATLDLSTKTVTLAAGAVTTHVTQFDDNALKNDIAMLGFKIASGDSANKYSLTDQIIDDFQDTSGIDTTNSINDGHSTGDYYEGQLDKNATGGVVTDVGSDKVHIFYTAGNGTSTNNFVVPTQGLTVDYLVVAGGGGAGDGNYGRGGGGGAGGFRNSYNNELSGAGSASETALSMSAGTFAVVVGAGGTGFPDAPSNAGTSDGDNGADSVFSTVTSIGGGGGASHNSGAAQNGGSGGGAGMHNTGIGTGNASQGGNGGLGSTTWGGGGGGGAGGVGGNATGNTQGGHGGTGRGSSITGALTLYAGGGGGSSDTTAGGDGGSGIGGDGTHLNEFLNSQHATDDTGSGGGAGAKGGGDGGNGIVIARYPGTFDPANMTLISASQTALSAPTKGDLIFSYSDGAGTATYSGGTPTIEAFLSRDGSAYTNALTLTKIGTSGTHTILAAHDVDLSGITSGTAIRYKITTINQSVSLATRIHAVSLGWS